ncbi:MAG: hypothetical protein K2N63_00155 [Lachnospiraceae bacterium]|nr:hypothetical protein [Lachnospiraceae bacterium]
MEFPVKENLKKQTENRKIFYFVVSLHIVSGYAMINSGSFPDLFSDIMEDNASA